MRCSRPPPPARRSLWLVRLLHAVPAGLLSIIADLAALVCFNRITLWWAALDALRSARCAQCAVLTCSLLCAHARRAQSALCPVISELCSMLSAQRLAARPDVLLGSAA